MRNNLSKLKKYYNKIPTWLRWIFYPLEYFYVLWFYIRPNVWKLKGRELSSNKKLTVIYCGTELSKKYFVKLIFNDLCEENNLNKIWFWQVYKFAKENAGEECLIILEIVKLFYKMIKKDNSFFIPTWAEGETEFAVDISEIIKNTSLSSDLRKMRKNNLDILITNDLEHFDYFYHNMYFPYIKNTFSNQAIIIEYASMKELFKKSDLIFLEKDNQYISGVLLLKFKDNLRLKSMGCLDGDYQYVKHGAISTLYFHAIMHAQKSGFKKVNWGYSRPFLKDGVLRYKNKWRIKLINKVKSGYLIYGSIKSEGVRNFFKNNPFIYKEKDDLYGAYFIDNGQTVSDEEYKKILKQLYIKGLKELIIYRFDENKIKKILPK